MIGEGGGSQHLFVSIAYSASESQEHIRNELPTARTNALEKKNHRQKKSFSFYKQFRYLDYSRRLFDRLVNPFFPILPPPLEGFF